jgi:hypothetical protein
MSSTNDMKNATKHAELLRATFRRLVRDVKPQPLVKLDALKSLVRGAMSYDVSDNRADEAVRLLEREFVDLNELRVATDLEIAELLGVRYPNIEQRVELITRALNTIFEKEHTLSLERMSSLSNRDVRQFLRVLPEMNPFVEAYVMLYSFDGHSVPLDRLMFDYLCDQGILSEKMSVLEAQKFIEHHLKTEECHDFYVSIRRAASEAEGSGHKKARK